jgi:hypothetical protein
MNFCCAGPNAHCIALAYHLSVELNPLQTLYDLKERISFRYYSLEILALLIIMESGMT